MTMRQGLPRLAGMLFACWLGAACTTAVSEQAGGIGTPPPGERPLMGNHRFIIPYADLDGLTRVALQGSADAALRLASYYQMILLDTVQGEYWLSIAAENGSIVAMYNLAKALQRSNDANKHFRARYWLARVAKEGPADLAARARDELRELGVQPQ